MTRHRNEIELRYNRDLIILALFAGLALLFGFCMVLAVTAGP